MFTQKREQRLLASPDQRIVMPLVQTRLSVALLLGDIDELLHFVLAVVGQSESLVLALLDAFVNRLRRVLDGRLAVGHVQVHSLYAGGLQVLERYLDALLDLRRLVRPGTAVLDLRVDDEPGRSPGSPEALLGAGVVARSVDVPVAPVVECI